MHYDDFVLQIEPGTEGSFESRVLQSPAGEGRAPLRFDLDDTVLDELTLDELVGDLSRQSRQHRDSGPVTREIVRRHGAPRGTPQEIGAALFRGAFSGQVGSLFDRSLGGLTAAQDRGLRIKLKLQGDDPRLARLAALPWELLRRGETSDYLGLDRRTPLVRYLDVPRPRPLIPLPPVLRVLVVIANPQNLESLDLGDELQRLAKAWRRQKRVAIDTLERASLAGLREALAEKTYHVIHFMGHGGFDPKSGEGVLFFESNQRQAVPVSGRSLAAKLKDHGSLGLVFLNACNTGRVAATSDARPFAGVASALVHGGLPAVLAMQFPITDDAAIRFSQTFYRHLAAGNSVDEAVTEGRQAIHSADPATIEWATPVLFIRTADGNVFHRPTRQPPWRAATAAVLLLAALILTVLFQPTLRSYFLPVSYALETTLVESTVDGVKIQLSRVEMRDDGRMRLHYEVVNESPEAQKVGFDLERAYLADEFGNKYEVLAARGPRINGEELSTAVAVSETVAPGGRLESWIDLPAPLDGASKLSVNLAAQDQAVAFPWLEVDLPDYPKRLGRVSKGYEPPPGALALPVAAAVDLGVEGLQSSLNRVEMLSGQRMRWNLQMLNTSTETQQIEIDFKRSYLLDENGQRYGVMGYDQHGGTAGWSVPGALRAERWLEFPSPRDGAQKFRVVLYSTGGRQLTELEVDLPEYDESFSQAIAEPELGLLRKAIDLVNHTEGLSSSLLGVTSLGDGRQRWHVELRNNRSQAVTVGFSYPRSYLADAHGQRYPVRAAESAIDMKRNALKKTLAGGERSLHYFDFDAPMTDPGSWWLVLAGHDRSLRWQPAAIGELPFPKGVARRRPAPRQPPDTAFEIAIERALKPCVAEVDCRLEAMFLRPGGMRWRFGFLNRGAQQRKIAFDPAVVRLQDEHGNSYRVLGTGAEDGFGGQLEPRLAADLWLDFGAPVDGARQFKMDLAGGLGMESFDVRLPEYPAELSPRSTSTATATNATESPALRDEGEGFTLLEGETPIETDLAGFQAKLVDLERFDDRSRLTIELWNGTGASVSYGFDLDRSQLSDGVMSSPSRVLRADTNVDPMAVKKRVVETLPPGGKAVHWFEFVGPRAAAKMCFVTLETYIDSQVTFGLLQVDLDG